MFSKLRTYLGGILQDINGCPSSKRWALIVAIVLICVSWLADLVWRIAVDPAILDAIKWIGSGSAAAVGAEYLGAKKND